MKKLFKLLLLLILHEQLLAQSRPGNNLLKVKKYSEGTYFTAIAVDDSGNVWAGTNKKGLYYASVGKDTNSSFVLVPSSATNDLTKMNINSIVADHLNNVWVGHGGAQNEAPATGGVLKRININNLDIHGFEHDQNAECISYLTRDGLPTNNISCIAVDKYNTVWTSHRANSNFTTSLIPGTIAFKRANGNKFYSKSTWHDYQNKKEAPELPYPAYTCKVHVTVSPGSRRCEAVACSNNEVWLSVFPYESTLSRKPPGTKTETIYLPSRILRYDLNGLYLGQVTFDSVGATLGGVFNSIYLTEKGDAWVSMTAGKGFAAKINGCWTLLNSTNLPTLFPSGTYVNPNAIWGNKSAKNGQVFIGTNKGLLVYNGVGKVDDESSYSLITTENGLVSNNITGGVSHKDSVQWLATDAGIIRLKSRNDFSIDTNYTSCNDIGINQIEAQASNDSHNNFDYHIYKVETTVCKKDGPNDKKCNAQYVYNLMIADVTLQAITPEMFPEDNLKVAMLIGLNDIEKKAFEAAVTNWDKIPHPSSETTKYGGIRNIKQLLDMPTLHKYYCFEKKLDSLDPAMCGDDGKLPFLDKLYSMDELTAEAFKNNKPTVVDCEVYKLYNSPNMIVDRQIYFFNDFLFCNGRLKSLEYDEVKIFPDDKNLTITNYTIEGHLLHPGKVQRSVIEECGSVKVVTVGTGLNYCAEAVIPERVSEAFVKSFNSKYGTKYGPLMAMQILTEAEKLILKGFAKMQARMNGNGNFIVGTILFKNIDMKLKARFNEKK